MMGFATASTSLCFADTSSSSAAGFDSSHCRRTRGQNGCDRHACLVSGNVSPLHKRSSGHPTDTTYTSVNHATNAFHVHQVHQTSRPASTDALRSSRSFSDNLSFRVSSYDALRLYMYVSKLFLDSTLALSIDEERDE